MEYEVKVENFEGPMDLLLFFIQRDRLNIYDIPISEITNEFLSYVKMMDVLNIEHGGEFVHMASMLMRIKAKMLLPGPADDEEEIEDPRTELVEQLLEYKRFKEAGDKMHLLHAEHGRHYSRGYLQKYDFKNKESTNEDFSLFSLSKIFHELMVTLPSDLPYSVNMDPVNVDEQIMFVIQQFKNSNRMLFHDLIPLLQTRLKIIVTFLAILQMLQENQLIIEQNAPFSDIVLIKKSHEL